MELFLQEYELLGDLSKGKGGYAEVFKVRHSELGYVRAVRVLKNLIIAPEGSDDPKDSVIYQKFLRECKILLQLGNGSHPNIVRIYKPDLRDNKAFVEMDYVKGKNIQEFMESAQHFVDCEEVIRLATQISSALAFCHEDVWIFRLDRNKYNLPVDPNDKDNVITTEKERRELIRDLKVLHNDIHSGNIMRRDDGNFVLLDFGLAINGDEVEISSSRQEDGAVAFIPPEKWNKKSYTEQSDIYSFGIVLYQCLAGRVPFPWNTTLSNEKAKYQIAEEHRNKLPDPIEPIRKKFFEERFPGQTYKRDYPQWLEDAIMKCLEKDPAKRFRNGKELYEYIKGHCQDANNAKYEMEIGQLASENKLLRLQVKDLRDTNAALNRQLNSTQNMLNQTQQTLRDTQDRLEKIRHQSNKSRIPLWILLILFGLWGAAASLYSWNNRPTELNRQLEEKNQAIASANDEINELKSTITDLQNGVGQSVPNTGESAEITRLTNLIAERDRKISSLEDQLSMQKPSDNSAEITRLNNIIKQKDQKIQDFELRLSQQKSADNTAELKRLNNEVTGLNNSIKQKDQKIQNLESTIKDKDKEIKALNDVIAGKTNK